MRVRVGKVGGGGGLGSILTVAMGREADRGDRSGWDWPVSGGPRWRNHCRPPAYSYVQQPCRLFQAVSGSCVWL